MNTKLLIVLVVALVILFVVGTGAGLVNEHGSASPTANLDQPWLSSFGSVFTPHVGIKDLTLVAATPGLSACQFGQNNTTVTISSSATCIFSVASFQNDVRKLVLRLPTATSASMAITVYQRDTFTDQLDQNDTSGNNATPPKDLDIYKDKETPVYQATLTIACTGGSDCSVQSK